MLNTNDRKLLINDILSIDQLHDVILKNAQNKLLDYTKSVLLKHNRSKILNFGFYTKDNQFCIANNTTTAWNFNKSFDNPHLKPTDDQNKISKISSQMLINYFNSLSISELIIITLKFDGFCNKNILNATLTANYLNFNTDEPDTLKTIAKYISKNCLIEFTVYWLEHFKIVEQTCQKDCKYLNIIIQPYRYDTNDNTVIPVFIKRIADLITTQYPNYLCKDLVDVIDRQITNKTSLRIDLPFKYLELYSKLWSSSHILIKDLNRNKELSPIPVNCQIVTANDEKYLLEMLVGTVHVNDLYFNDYQLNELTDLGLTFDVNNHQADISKLVNNLKLLPKADNISKYINWLQKTFL